MIIFNTKAYREITSDQEYRKMAHDVCNVDEMMEFQNDETRNTILNILIATMTLPVIVLLSSLKIMSKYFYPSSFTG